MVSFFHFYSTSVEEALIGLIGIGARFIDFLSSFFKTPPLAGWPGSDLMITCSGLMRLLASLLR